MTLHQTIKEQIVVAMRAKDALRLETLRGLNALIINEMLATKPPIKSEFLPDDRVLALIKRSAKQRKDSIAQFKLGKRDDLVAKEEAELEILESFLPQMMSQEEVGAIVKARIEKLKSEGTFDPKSAGLPAQAGKLTGMIMKELAGKADGADVKAAVDELVRE
jgi:uncharacterized protein YqeY